MPLASPHAIYVFWLCFHLPGPQASQTLGPWLQSWCPRQPQAATSFPWQLATQQLRRQWWSGATAWSSEWVKRACWRAAYCLADATLASRFTQLRDALQTRHWPTS